MRPCLFLALGLLSVPAGAQMGAITHTQKIDDVEGGFTGVLDPDGGFGLAVANLGDVNGDGVPDVAVAAPMDDDGGTNAGAVWIVFLDASGMAVGQQKISSLSGGLGPVLGASSSFGRDLAPVGDLDGNGVPDFAALAAGPHRLVVVRLNANGTVLGETVVPFDAAPFPAGQPLDAFRKSALCSLGDLAGDGHPELVVSAPYDDDGHINAGALWVLSLGPTGAPTGLRKISELSPDLGPVLGGNALAGQVMGAVATGPGGVRLLVSTEPDLGHRYHDLVLDVNATVIARREMDVYRTSGFWPTPRAVAPVGDLDGDGEPDALFTYNYQYGSAALVHLAPITAPGDLGRRALVASEGENGLAGFAPVGVGNDLAALGDLDGDGTLEFAVGSGGDVGGGAFWIYSMATSAVRNGSGLNPVVLSEDAEPSIGSTWTLTVDASGHAPGMALVSAWGAPASGTFLSIGEVLVDVGSPRAFLAIAAHSGDAVDFPVAIPNALPLVNRQLFVQALISGAPAATLTNALGVVVGRP